MELPEILATKDPSSFTTRSVRIRQSDDGDYTLTPEGEELTFAAMAKRRKPVDPELILRELPEGHLFANLGVSTVLTTMIKEIPYLLLVRQERHDLGDSVAKLVSGYLSFTQLAHPRAAVDEEIAEEIIPFTSKGGIIPGIRRNALFPQPFHERCDTTLSYFISSSSLFRIPQVIKNDLYVRETLMPGAQLYFNAPTDSAQLVYHNHIQFPNGCLEQHKVSLHHSEDILSADKKTLEVRLHKQGVLLGRIDCGQLTNQWFTLNNGKLQSFIEPITLSEAFAPKTNGISLVNNIPLKTVLDAY